LKKKVLAALALVVAVAATSIVATRAAQASIPHSATGQITACLNADHAMRVIDEQAGAACSAGETTLRWNVSIAGLETVTSSSPSNSADKQQQATCPAGKKAIAGGWTLTDPDAAVVVASYPSFADVWRVDADDRTAANWGVTAYALCAVA
jgi:hypothetical protein